MNISILKRVLFPLLALLCSLSLSSCWPKPKQNNLLINGAGASFPYILYSKWLKEYHKADPMVAINYQSIGSGGGIRQFIKGTLDFGGTDIPVPPEDIQAVQKEIIHIPTALGAVAITYNLKLGKKQSLQLDGAVLSQIFRGQVKVWNDPQIQKLNPHLRLPQRDIVAVYRADGSGTTSFFTEYLSLLSKGFLQEIGRGKSVPWPVGVGGKGNEGVMGLVNKITGAIAYIGASYAASQKLPMAAIKNSSGQFIAPSLKSIKAAAAQAMRRKKSYTSSLINIDGKNSYPLAGYTYIIIAKRIPEKKGKALVKFLKWALTQGQKFSESLYFIPLPEIAVKSALKNLSQVEFEPERK